jgi:hypothetical protein
MNTLPKRPLQDLPAPHGAGPVNVVGVDGAGCVNSAFRHVEETQALTHFPSPIITNTANEPNKGTNNFFPNQVLV